MSDTAGAYRELPPQGVLSALVRIRFEPWLAKTLPVAFALSGVGAVLPPFLAGANVSYVGVLAMAAGVAWLIARAEEAEHRPAAVSAFAWALAVRLFVLTALWVISVRQGGPFLGPDSSTYFEDSTDLAAANFRLLAHPIVEFGSLNVAQYYLFAALIRYLHADLFALQLFNCACTALVAPLMFGITRRLLPQWAGLAALAAAFYPSLIVVSANDLLKDPSVILASVVVLRVVIDEGGSWRRVLTIGVAGFVALLYLRTARGYVVFHAEFAGIATLGYAFTQTGWTRSLQRRTVLTVVLFLLAEAAPMTLGWPSSPSIMIGQITHTLETDAMRKVDRGLLSRRRHSAVFDDDDEFGASPLNPVNVFRKVYGPFVWIVPPRWAVEDILRADYLLYPGMVIWYIALPVVLWGVWLSVRDWTTHGPRLPLGLLASAIFFVTYGLQYLAINVSYRQREAMFPFLVLFGLIGASGLPRLRWWRPAYAAYWALLVVVAVAHLIVRARLGLD